MKFEKFVKGCGTYGQVYKRPNGEKWLICDGVGMLIPTGVDNLLGVGEVPEKIKKLVEGLIMVDTTDRVELTRATVSADGNAKDITRWFGYGDYQIGINNADFGLLEKKDIDLALVEVEDPEDDLIDEKYLLVLDHNYDVIGFIREQ
jgi:hypothetical protein